MTYYNRIRIILTSVILFYSTCALFLHYYEGRNEVFPFFTWELYARVPNRVTDYTIRITALNGKELEKPLYFQQSRKYFSKAHSVSAYFAFKKLGKAIRSGNKKKINYHRKYIEQIYLAGYESLEYDVVSRSYNPLNKIRNNKIKKSKSLKSFSLGVYK